MPNQGYKVRSFRLPDDKYEKLMAVVQENNCKDLRDFITRISTHELEILNKVSKNT